MRCRRCEISVSVSGFFLGEDVEDRLQRAVAARAVQAQLVAEAAPRVSAPSAPSSAASALIGSARAAICIHRVAERLRRSRRGRRSSACTAPSSRRRSIRRMTRPARARRASSSARQRRQVHRPRSALRLSRKQPQRASDVAGRQHEAVRGSASPSIKSRSTWRRPGKFSNVRSSSDFVEQERAPVRPTGRARRVKKASSASNASRGEWASASTSGAGNGDASSRRAKQPLGRGRDTLDVDVLAAAFGRAARAVAAAATCGPCRSRRAGPESAADPLRAPRARAVRTQDVRPSCHGPRSPPRHRHTHAALGRDRNAPRGIPHPHDAPPRFRDRRSARAPAVHRHQPFRRRRSPCRRAATSRCRRRRRGAPTPTSRRRRY